MLCRLCVYESCDDSSMISLFDVSGESDYLKIIAKHMQLELTQEDSISKTICCECANRLNDLNDFCKFVEERQKYVPIHNLQENEIAIEDQLKLTNLLVDNKIYSNEENVNNSKNNNLHPIIKDELTHCEDVNLIRSINDECNDDENCDNEINDFLLSESRSEVNNNSDESNNEGDYNPVKRKGKANVRKTKNIVSKKRIRLAGSKNKQTKDCNNDEKDEKSGKLSKHEQLIAQHLTIKCELCGEIEDTFFKLLAHYREKHNTTGYLKCCSKHFKRRYHLYEHLKFHLNPELYKCEVCGKNLKSKNCYKKHKQDMHPENDQLKFECDICGKKHANKHSAQKHRERHNAVRVTCNLCNKSLTTKYSLENHIKNMHEQQINPYICDTCGREYKCKLSFNKHVAEHQGIITKNLVQCELCEEWVVRLDKHMERHNHTDVKCHFCGKISTSKSGLRSHIEKLHRDIPELPCSFCNKTFKYKKNLKEHIAMHTNTKDYKCKYCEREFRSSANMYAHIKRGHAEQWLEAQSARKRKPEDGTNAQTYQ